MNGRGGPLVGLHDRRIFVTGDTGFKGSWLTLLLEAAGAQVAGFALPPRQPSLYQLLGRRTPPWGYGDVRDASRLEEALRSHEPAVVFHLAAQALVRRSYDDPAATFSTNVLGTLNLLEAARRCPSVRAVVVVTSDKCYLNDGAGEPFREDHPLGGHDPYSASKAAAEMVAAAYRGLVVRSRPPVGLATARAGNVLGGGDWADERLLPDILRSLESAAPLRLRHPAAVRPWQHALDVCHGYGLLALALLRQPVEFSRPWNFAPPAGAPSLSAREMAGLAFRAWGAPPAWDEAADADRQRPEAMVLRLDAELARGALGWRALLSTEEAVTWTVAFHRELMAGTPAAVLCGRQIADYQRRLEPGD